MYRLLLTAFTTIAAIAPLHTSAQSLIGAWKQVEIEVMEGPNAGTVDTESLWHSLDLYRPVSQSECGGSPRTTPEGPLTAEDEAELYRTYAAFAGTYELDGSELILDLDVALDPAHANPVRREISLTDSTLEVSTTGAAGARTVRRYVRVD